MGLWDKLKGELIDIIEWIDTSNNSIAFRFERHNNEIKNGAKLIVRESQIAVFQNEGEFYDVYTPGTHTLETQNMPLLSTLKGWKYGFNSPFKAEVIFVNTNFIPMNWGTGGYMMVTHPDYMNVKIKARGQLKLSVKNDPESVKAFLRYVVSTDDHFTYDELFEYIKGDLIGAIRNVIQKDPKLVDLFGNDEMNDIMEERLQEEFSDLGINIRAFNVIGHEYDEDTQNAMNIRRQAKAKSAAINEYSDMNKFMQFQMGNSMENLSNNPDGGGGAGTMMGAGLGFAMGNNMMNMQGNMNQNPQANMGGGAVPPPLPGAIQYFVAAEGKQFGPFAMPQLQQMIQSGQLTRESMVWKQGMANWEKAGAVQDLTNLFGAVPPPPPPM